MIHKTMFIADLHLSEMSTDLNQTFFDFLENLEADALYILGDLFEYWIGEEDQCDFHEKIAGALKKISSKMPVYFMYGNRDFLISAKWMRHCGMRFLKDPSVITLYHHRILLSHGDLFCTQDKSHQWFRLITRNLLFQKIFLMLPLFFRKQLAEKTREKSIIKNQSEKKFSPIMDVQKETIQKYLKKYNAKYIIHGHTHKPKIHQEENYIHAVLPSWDSSTKYRYLSVFVNSDADLQFKLNTFF